MGQGEKVGAVDETQNTRRSERSSFSAGELHGGPLQGQVSSRLLIASSGRIAQDSFHRFVQWDVNNEMLHHQWFEGATGDPYITDKLINLTHTKDPEAVIMVNDYNIVKTGVYTSVSESSLHEYILLKLKSLAVLREWRE